MKLFNSIRSIKKFFFPKSAPRSNIVPHLFTLTYPSGEWLGFSGGRNIWKDGTEFVCVNRYDNGDICTEHVADYLCPIDRITSIEIKPDLLIVHCSSMNYHLEIPHTPQTFRELNEIITKTTSL